MPRITINEKDLTASSALTIDANVVYVPGIASFVDDTEHKESTIQYFTSLDSFQSKFGKEPYKFKSQQEYDFDNDGTASVVAKAGEYERSYIYATELLRNGINILFEQVVDPTDYIVTEELTVSDSGIIAAFYEKLIGTGTTELTYSVYNKLQDRWTYNIKYITSGGYDIFSYIRDSRYKLVENICLVASARGDTVALVDHSIDKSAFEIYNVINTENGAFSKTNIAANYTLKVSTGTNLNIKLNPDRDSEITLKYASIVSPWGTYSTIFGDYKMPGSFAYLKCLAQAIKVYGSPDYYAVAGVTRGLVPGLKQLEKDTTGAEADEVQAHDGDGNADANKISIVPIVNVSGYGICIWGNKTLYPNESDGSLSASSFLNIRIMASDVKKIIYAACQKYTFETNSTELWLKFKSDVEPTLEKMVADGALEKYELTRVSTNKKATLALEVKLYTLYAVEDFNITISLTDSTVEEV